jgi:hypothetical protein
MRHKFALAAFFSVAVLSGCATQQPDQTQAQSQPTGSSQPQPQMVIAPKVEDVPAHALPFKGKLLSGDRNELPPAVAMSLSDTSPVTFTYREELTHDEYHAPLIISWALPANWEGAPTGDIGVTAFASLSVSVGDTVLGDYTAKEHASKSYNMYAQPTHKEVDDAALAAVRQRIEEKLYKDEARLALAAASAGKSATASAGK